MPLVLCSTVEKKRRVVTGCAVARLSRGQTETDQYPSFFQVCTISFLVLFHNLLQFFLKQNVFNWWLTMCDILLRF